MPDDSLPLTLDDDIQKDSEYWLAYFREQRVKQTAFYVNAKVQEQRLASPLTLDWLLAHTNAVVDDGDLQWQFWGVYCMMLANSIDEPPRLENWRISELPIPNITTVGQFLRLAEVVGPDVIQLRGLE